MSFGTEIRNCGNCKRPLIRGDTESQFYCDYCEGKCMVCRHPIIPYHYTTFNDYAMCTKGNCKCHTSWIRTKNVWTMKRPYQTK